MKLSNILVGSETHVALLTERGVVDATAAGLGLGLDEVVAGKGRVILEKIAADPSLPAFDEKVCRFTNLITRPAKILCVGLNYSEHAANCGEKTTAKPTIFSKFPDSLSCEGAQIPLPAWETSYDYEAELVIVMGKDAWNVSEEEVSDCIFGYTCGNDLSIREAQMRTSQWLIGKAWKDSGPCGAWITTADGFDPAEPHAVRCYVNGQRRQDGLTSQMIFRCSELVSYISRYIPLVPGDLIFSGTPSGVIAEKKPEDRVWLKAGDTVTVEIEGLGSLTNLLIS